MSTDEPRSHNSGMRQGIFKKTLLDSMIATEMIKFGKFKLKSGLESNVYIDIRSIVGYPWLMKELVNVFKYDVLPELKVDYQLLVGVPWGAVPLATIFSYETGSPMIILRDKPKDYGLRNLIEAKPQNSDIKKCLLIEDVVTTGSSVAEAIRSLQKEGFEVTTVIVIVDRREHPGPIENVPVISILSLNKIMEYQQRRTDGRFAP